MSLFKNKTLLITGGTGSFGNAVLNRFLATDIGEIRIFSRDEKKQDDMRHDFQVRMPEVAEKIKFYIGDVRDLASVKQTTSKTADFMLFLLVPGAFGIFALAEPIVSSFLQRGSFDATSLEMTAGALCCYSIGLPFLAVRDMLIKVFYAYKDTKTTTTTSIIAIAMNIGLNFLFSYFWGINGLALATSISAVFQCLILYVLLRKKIGDFGLKATLFSLGKGLLAAIIMALAVSFAYQLLASAMATVIARLLLSVILGLLVYAILVLLFRVPAALGIWNRVFKRHKTAR